MFCSVCSMKALILLPLIIQAALATSPIVNIPTLGKIQGVSRLSFKGQEFLAFEGVPYARPPVGKYRFREPVPVKSWTGVWQAKTIYKCMQYYQYTLPGDDFVIGDEDCLYLNIYTPTLDTTANLDVIVYIHGGAFMFNWGGIYQPDYIIDENLVFISVNYRLGPLGFLSTENDIIPGNNGLKDQIQALRWVQDHVALFGGNPNSVTIFGMSAGGASVHFHYMSPKSRNLFHRGISQSGTMLNPWVLVEQSLEKTIKLAVTVGCETYDLKRTVDCLRRKPARQIVASVKEFQPWLYNPFSPFGVVVDSWAHDPVLPEHPFQMLKQKKVENVPWISSYTNSEGLYPAADFYSDDGYLNDIETRWNEIMPFILDYNYTVKSQDINSVSQKIRQKYLNGKTVNRENFQLFVKIITDRIFAVDIEKGIKLHAKAGGPVYSYFFTYRGAHSKSEGRAATNKDFGAAHGDDTSYILKMNVDTETTSRDRHMIQLMTKLVGSFAKTGTPDVDVEWNPQNGDHLTYLHIASPTSLVMANSSLDATFWESLPFQENEKLFSGVKDEL